ncbi:DUF2177 family protein [soil metagenome]
MSYLAAAATFLVLDMAFLTVSVDRVYKPHIGHLMADKVALGPAAAFYLIYIAAILLLAVLPAARAASWSQLLTSAAIFGFAAYATYDLTNQATLRGWSSLVTVVDLAWGTFVTTAAASAGYLVARHAR